MLQTKQEVSVSHVRQFSRVQGWHSSVVRLRKCPVELSHIEQFVRERQVKQWLKAQASHKLEELRK